MAPPWPEHPLLAVDAGAHWTVKGVPPDPWPWQHNPPFDPVKFGPPGTWWVFTGGDILDRITGVPASQQFLKVALQDLYNKLCLNRPDRTLFVWQTPAPDGVWADPLETDMSIKVLRCVIHGKIGTLEEVAHVMHFRSNPTPDVPMQKSDLDAFSNTVKTNWQNFLTSTPSDSGGSPVRGYFPPDLTYDEVRLSYITVYPKGPDGKIPKPTYDVPTQFYPLVGAAFQGAGGTAVANNVGIRLPNEVALCISLNSNLRGGRHRGRTYMGPLMSGTLGNDGMFSTVVDGIAKRFGDTYLHGFTTAMPFGPTILSPTYAESWPITGVRVGHVPDAQRRRRRSLPEAYFQAWGTAPGV